MKPHSVLLVLCLFCTILTTKAQTANEALSQMLDHSKWKNDPAGWKQGAAKAINDGADDKKLITDLLFTATAMGDFEIFNLAIQHGADILHVRDSDNNNTVLHYAAIYGKNVNTCDIVYYIHQHANDLYNYKNSQGDRAIDLSLRDARKFKSSDLVYKCFLNNWPPH